MDLSTFGGLAIVGAVVAAIVQGLKAAEIKFGHWTTVGIAVGLSLIGAALYVALVQFGYWSAFVQILTIASTIYAIFISYFEKKGVTS